MGTDTIELNKWILISRSFQCSGGNVIKGLFHQWPLANKGEEWQMDYCKHHRQGDFEPSSFNSLGFGTQPLGPHFPGNRTHFFLGEPSVSTQYRMAFDQCNQSTVSKYILILKLCYNSRVPVKMLAEAMRGTQVYVRIALKLPGEHKEKINTQSNGNSSTNYQVLHRLLMSLFRSPKVSFSFPSWSLTHSSKTYSKCSNLPRRGKIHSVRMNHSFVPAVFCLISSSIYQAHDSVPFADKWILLALKLFCKPVAFKELF